MPELDVRSLEQRDLSIRVAWLNHPRIYGQMSVTVPISLAGTQQWFSRTLLNASRCDFVFVAPWIEEDKPVAMGGLVDIDQTNRRAELYIFVAPERIGQGYGQAAVRWLCNYGFTTYGFERIYLNTLGHNTGARRLYERNGFVFEGRLRKHVFHRGQFVDRYVLGLLREDWVQLPWAHVGEGTPEVDR